MKRAMMTAALLFNVASISKGQVQPLEDAPSVLRLSSGAEVKVLDVFKTTLIETDEPALVLRYPTSKIKDDLCSEVEEVWAAFRPIVEKEGLRAAVIFQTAPSGGGFTWIWKQDAQGVWDSPKEGDEGTTANGLNGPDLIAETRRANAIVHLRLIFEPGLVTDPKYPNLQQQVIQNVSVVQTLKKSPGFLGDAALREACSAWRTGDKWPSSGAPAGYVDYLVLNALPLGDFDRGAYLAGGLHLVPVTEGVLRNVERALRSPPHSE
jgi:hypothetical protein